MEQNRANWDDRARLHARADTGYRLDRYRQNRDLLSDVVAFDRTHLGDLTGLRVLHLQCHIGTDTLSLARLGADVVGLDQSAESLDAARELFDSVETKGRFVEANVYDAVDALDGEHFDLVYTGVGALNWLPDVGRWGRVVGDLVAPGGRFWIREGHPMLLALDEEAPGGVLRLKYPYFETDEPMVFDETETYVDTGDERLTATRTFEWAHAVSEVFTALTAAGLRVVHFEEHRHLDWKSNDLMVERDDLWWFPPELRDVVPTMYSMLAIRPVD